MIAIGQNTAEFHLYVGKAWLAGHNTDQALKEFQAAVALKPELPLVHFSGAHLSRTICLSGS